MANSKYFVLVVTDSRAADIKSWIDWGDVELDVVPAKGAGIEAAVEVLMTQCRDVTPDLVLVLNGVCDILVKSRLTRKYFMIAETVPEVVDHFLKQVKRGQELLEIFFDEAKWMFNPLTGLDICDYNNPDRKKMTDEQLTEYHNKKTPDPLQPVLNQAVIEINREVVQINKRNGVLTPYTATYVHRHYGNSYHHSYQYTGDGCHLTPDCKGYWGKQLLKAITKTRDKYQNVNVINN